MRLAFALLVLLPACDCTDGWLTPYCPSGQACWFNDTGTVPTQASTGECRAGAIVCAADGTATCEGRVGPVLEQCDGLDNDCDGVVDEGVSIPVDIPSCYGQVCGRCAPPAHRCELGAWRCVGSDFPVDEVCNRVDDDCNCEVDDVPAEFFYDGPPATVGRGDCRPGVRYCDFGVEVEVAPVYPTDEVCDGVDNDCDGFVDEDGFPDPEAYLLVLDVSGSMGSVVAAVAQAFCDFSLAAPPGGLYAVALVAGHPTRPFVYLAQDFQEAVVTCQTLTSPNFGVSWSGAEYMLDGVVAADGLWPPLDSTVVAFTDEPLQKFVTDTSDVIASCLVEPYEVVVYAAAADLPDWDQIVQDCGGAVLPLPLNTDDIQDALVRQFLGSCQ